jgi:hypothetical protein
VDCVARFRPGGGHKGAGRIFLHDAESDSFAVLDTTGPNEDGCWKVQQVGSRKLWDELEASFDAGEPDLDMWQVAVDAAGTVSLDLKR